MIKRVFGGDVLMGRSRLTAERSPRVSVNYISQYRADVASSSPSETRSLYGVRFFSVWYHLPVSFVCDLYCVCGALHAELSSTYVMYLYAYL